MDDLQEIDDLALSLASEVNGENEDATQEGDFDPLEIVFLDCYDYYLGMPAFVLEDRVTKNTLRMIRMHTELPCNCKENTRLGSLYVLIEKDTPAHYYEIPVCNVCASEIAKIISLAAEKFPLNSLVTYMSNVGRIYCFHKYVLII